MHRQDRGHELPILWAVSLASMLVSLNSTMMTMALPRLIREFNTTLGSMTWLVTSYLIAIASLQPLAGKLGDRLGQRPLFLGGLAWLAIASAGAAASDSLALLFIFRIQQAVAGALLLPNGVAVLREVVPPERLGRKIGLVGATMPLTAAAGLLLGGLLLATGGWRAIFWINLPLLLAPLVLGWLWIPRRIQPRASGRFDLPGALLLTGLLAGTAGLLKSIGTDFPILVGGGMLIGLFGLFLRLELQHPDPVLQPRLFVRGSFAGATGAVAASNSGVYVLLIALPVMLSRRGGFGEGGIGLLLTPMMVAAFAFSLMGGRLADSIGRRAPAMLGLGVSGASLIPLALIPARISMGGLMGVAAAVGAGAGLAEPALKVAALESVEKSATGLAAGVLSMSRCFGNIVSTSLLGGLLARDGGGFGGFTALFLMASGGVFASALLSLLLPGRVRARRPPGR